jgi:hypothetical protein
MNDQHAGNPAAEYKNALPGLQLRCPESTENTAKRFMKSGFLIRNAIRNEESSPIHINSRKTYKFCKTSWIKICSAEGIAGRMVPCQAVRAGVAGNMVGRDNAVSFFKFIYAIPHLDHLTGHLMPKDKRRFMETVPFQNITAADPAGVDFHEKFPRPDIGYRDFF